MAKFNAEKYIEEELARMRKEEEIRCPYCNYLLQDLWEYGNLISIYGNDFWVDVNCPECEQDFEVLEYVRRTYEVREKDENNQGD